MVRFNDLARIFLKLYFTFQEFLVKLQASVKSVFCDIGQIQFCCFIVTFCFGIHFIMREKLYSKQVINPCTLEILNTKHELHTRLIRLKHSSLSLLAGGL